MLCDLVLQEDGIRAAARRSGAPPSTVTAALQRLEAELSIPLVRRSGGKLAFSRWRHSSAASRAQACGPSCKRMPSAASAASIERQCSWA